MRPSSNTVNNSNSTNSNNIPNTNKRRNNESSNSVNTKDKNEGNVNVDLNIVFSSYKSSRTKQILQRRQRNIEMRRLKIAELLKVENDKNFNEISRHKGKSAFNDFSTELRTEEGSNPMKSYSEINNNFNYNNTNYNYQNNQSLSNINNESDNYEVNQANKYLNIYITNILKIIK